MPGVFFAISRANGDAQVEKVARRFAADLGRASALELELRLVNSYDELFATLRENAAILAWLPPLLYSRAAVEGLVLAGVPERKGSLSFRAAILKRRGSPPWSLDDVVDVRVAWGDRASASGYVFPRQRLLSAGAVFASETFHGSSGEAAREVAAGRADLCACVVSGAAGAGVQAAAREVLGPVADDLEVLGLTELIPPDGLAISVAAPEAVRAALLAGLLRLHETREGSAALRDLLRADRVISAREASMRMLRPQP